MAADAARPEKQTNKQKNCKKQPRNLLFASGQVKDHESKEELIRKQWGFTRRRLSHDSTFYVKGLFTFHSMVCPCPGGLSFQ